MIGNVKEVVFMGTGPSTGLPMLSCTLPDCRCCPLAIASVDSRNRRRNTQIAILTTGGQTVLIDCGKTFYQAALDTLVPRGITKIDAVLLTHGHADAILGLDDLRHYSRTQPIIVYCDLDTFNVVQCTFPYLVRKEEATGSGVIADIQFHVFSPMEALTVAGVRFVPLRVEHGVQPDGSPFYALGYRIDQSLVYLSDISLIPQNVLSMLESRDIDTLVLDCLHADTDFVSHVGWPGAERIIRQLGPRRTWLVGMSHHIEHDAFNAGLPSGTLCAHDGLVLEFEDGEYRAE